MVSGGPEAESNMAMLPMHDLEHICWLFKFFQLYAPLSLPNTAAEKYVFFAVIVIVTIACKDIPNASIAATGDLLFTFSTFCSKLNTFIQDVY